MSVNLTKEQIEDLIVYCGSSPTFWKDEKMQFCCPVHGESHPSCGVNSEIQAFNCFSCGAHGNFAKMLYLSRPEDFGYDSSTKEKEEKTKIRAEIKAWQFLADRYELEFKIADNKVHSVRRYDELNIKKKEEREEQPLWKIAPFHSGKATYQYFFDRGFTKEDMRKFFIGYDDVSKTVTIPVFYKDSTLAGVIGRYIAKDRLKNQRYKIYDFFNRSKLLFPLNLFNPINGEAILVEGQFDAIRMYHYGFTNTLALMTDHISKFQIEILERSCYSVIYIGDNDKQGIKARGDNYEKLKGIVDFKVVDFPDHGKDVCDWSKEEIINMVTNAHSIINRKIRRYE